MTKYHDSVTKRDGAKKHDGENIEALSEVMTSTVNVPK